jgi:2,3-bisphosphoglycerate-dependent phosphoglycerate mutase
MTTVEHLVVVRHAMPELVPEVPSQRWHLGAEGRAAAQALRPLLVGSAYFVASDEPKAVETLQELAGQLDVEMDPGFGEVRRPHVWSDDRDYRTTARAYVEGVRHDGWEQHDDVFARFESAVVRHAEIAAAQRRTLVVGTHGLAPTVWLSRRIRLEPSPAQFWAGLRFPDLIEVDLTAGRWFRPA